mgnify:CR=1 FL=1
MIVVGSLAGQWFGVMQKLGLVSNFWFGHQGYEYVDLGRFWQAFLIPEMSFSLENYSERPSRLTTINPSCSISSSSSPSGSMPSVG